ncbi:ankyrin repeat domain-containing protein, partial [Treponema sp. JC4]|uniref:ankyrin repeat domain-containing protein n=1 Tax=Treponema sp. JC4 TaxID=1124982 RepID=UPI0012DD43AE
MLQIFLISKGVNIDSKLVYSRETALSFAVKNNSKDVVELIISMGRVKIGGLLTKAVEANAYDIVKLLIREGAYCGKTVLNYA